MTELEKEHEWRISLGSFEERAEMRRQCKSGYASGMQGIYIFCKHCGVMCVKGGNPTWPYTAAPLIPPDDKHLEMFKLTKYCEEKTRATYKGQWWSPVRNTNGLYAPKSFPGCDKYNYGPYESCENPSECLSNCKKLNNNKLQQLYKAKQMTENEYQSFVQFLINFDYDLDI